MPSCLCAAACTHVDWNACEYVRALEPKGYRAGRTTLPGYVVFEGQSTYWRLQVLVVAGMLDLHSFKLTRSQHERGWGACGGRHAGWLSFALTHARPPVLALQQSQCMHACSHCLATLLLGGLAHRELPPVILGRATMPSTTSNANLPAHSTSMNYSSTSTLPLTPM